ncbi:MAG: ATP-binding protein, partial [Bacillota bacterium]|nr:ATP-binding protein [Bacillota bacterium]
YIIYVHNSGPRIPDRLKEEIFNPGVTTKGSPARGYGLYLVKKLVEEYGGHIEVISGDKTTFIIYLPDLPIPDAWLPGLPQQHVDTLRAGYTPEPEKIRIG